MEAPEDLEDEAAAAAKEALEALEHPTETAEVTGPMDETALMARLAKPELSS